MTTKMMLNNSLIVDCSYDNQKGDDNFVVA